MVKFVTFLAIVTLAGLVHVYAEVEAVKIGYTIRKQEAAKVQFLDRARALKYTIAKLKAPNNLERRLESQKIILNAPKAWQTLVLTPGTVRTSPRMERLPDLMKEPPFFTRIFVGTAQAQAKDN